MSDSVWCLVIVIEIVSYNLELLDKNHGLMPSVLSTVYHQVLNPKRGNKQVPDDQGIDVRVVLLNLNF